ncbi:hypothetical protein BMS3Abin06_02644 [bacterium BMS3Abin06]|nr:hypothetical protein BMS3Abin06_02644 [bacterium BMS3Abin06]
MEIKDVENIVEAAKDEINGILYMELSGLNSKLDRIIELLENSSG